MTKYFFLLIFAQAALLLNAYEARGTASWYGPNFQGKKTANGEIFDTEELTAAHKTLPFDTLVRVTNLSNGKSVTVRINDRGPYVDDRLIDLSRKGAETLGMIDSGTAPVLLETLDPAVEAISYSGPLTFTIQVAAFSDLINALNMKEKLTAAGFIPVARLSNEGVTRLFIDSIPAEECYGVVGQLEKLGLTGLVIRQDR
ncbi:MAG: septal ring lytic transglycosylase RlpA family protein [Spirochaetales bacterium]|nr:septal ring lytic transglycosylase RlpA family protein [Spirochaetales bacterium]